MNIHLTSVLQNYPRFWLH